MKNQISELDSEAGSGPGAISCHAKPAEIRKQIPEALPLAVALIPGRTCPYPSPDKLTGGIHSAREQRAIPPRETSAGACCATAAVHSHSKC